MESKLTKKQRREVEELQGTAWERELDEELQKLYEVFSNWKGGNVDAFDLSQSIHEFHDKAGRKLWKFYAHRNPFAVPSAIARGLISESEISAGLMEVLSDDIERFRETFEE